tara:strand:- start:157 stop:273 length:117 start_codon:yes stop_codon:yes gene_type:complete
MAVMVAVVEREEIKSWIIGRGRSALGTPVEQEGQDPLA